jgi:PAS domain S-box-containing protein
MAGDLRDPPRILESESRRASAGDRLLRTVVDASPLAIWAIDSDANVVLWNASAERLTGWPAEEVIGRQAPIVPDDDRGVFETMVARVFAGESILDSEQVRIRRDGRRVDWSLSLAPLLGPDGRVVAMMTIAADVSERRRAREETAHLAAREAAAQAAHVAAAHAAERNRVLGEASMLLTSSFDYDSVVARIADVAVPTLADWCVVDLVSHDDRSVWRAAARHVTAEGQALLDRVTRRFPPDANRPTLARVALETRRPQLVSDVTDAHIETFARSPEQARLVRRLGLRSYIVVPLIARERLLGVLALASSSRRYTDDDLLLAEELGRRSAIAADNARLFRESELSRAGAEAAAERAASLQAITAALARAATPAEVMETVLREGLTALDARTGSAFTITDDGGWLELVHSIALGPQLEREFRRFEVYGPYPLSEAVRTGRPVFLENRRAAVSRYPNLVDANVHAVAESWMELPLMANGFAIGGLGFGFAEPRAFSEEIQSFAAALAQQCAHALERARLAENERVARTDAEQARGRAEEANRAKMDFLTTMSHELRTPLNAITGHVDLLDLGVYGPVNEAQRDGLTRIRRAGHQLLAIINDILNFATLDAGRLELEIAPIRMSGLLSGLEALVAPQLETKGLVYTYEGCDPEIVARGDAERVHQILINVLGNAVKFTPSGGRIGVHCEAERETVRVHVRDTGVGIPAGQLDRIFEPFVQLGRTLTAAQEGTGLGLAISRHLARAMGGELSVESSVGRGSLFTLSLPR